MSSLIQDLIVKLIGIKNITDSAGATTLIYLLKKRTK